MATIHPTSGLLGYTVRNRSGEDIGTVADFIVDHDRKQVRYAIVSFGGLLGIGEHHYAVPFERLKLDTENECFIVDLDRRELESAADLTDARDDRAADDARRAVYRYQGVDALRRGVP